MEIRIHGMKNLTDSQQMKIKSALLKGGPVLDSLVWERRITNASYTENRGLSGAEIVKLIKSGADGLDHKADGILDVEIEGFFDLTSTIGYTYVGGYIQYFNKRFLDSFQECDVFRHILHELMHRAYGFVHRHRKATSVPYRVGDQSSAAFVEYYASNNKDFLLSSVRNTNTFIKFVEG